MTSNDRPCRAGVEQGGDNTAVKDPVVRGKMVGIGQVELDSIRIPALDADPHVMVEGDALLPVAPKPVPAKLLFVIGERHATRLYR